MQALTLMRGFPASGKTTKAYELRDAHTIVISLDALRRMTAGSLKRFHEDGLNDRRLVVDTAEHMVGSALGAGYSVIYDAQNVRAEDVKRAKTWAEPYDAELKTADCTAPLDELLRRNANRADGDRIPDKYIRSQYRRFRDTAFLPVEQILNPHKNLLDEMRLNPNVRVKAIEDGLYACNFTRDAFLNHDWDAYSSKARGLFLDAAGNVAMRGYDKFFNIGENEETSLDNVLKHMTYPARVETKQNGFLGLIGARDDATLRYYSKSGPTDYSALVEESFKGSAGDRLLDIWKVLHDRDVTLACEIVDIDSDRHIIHYDYSTCYALHCIKNQVEFEVDEEADAMIRDILPKDSQTRAAIARDEGELLAMLADAKASKREGVVVYGANGYMAKVKSDHYLKVKSLRTPLKRVLLQGKDAPNDNDERSTLVRKALAGIPREKLTYRRKHFNELDVDMTAVSDWLNSGN
jgi:predicted kinase